MAKEGITFGPFRQEGIYHTERLPATGSLPSFDARGAAFVRFDASGEIIAMTALDTDVLGYAEVGMSPGSLLVDAATEVFTAQDGFPIGVAVDLGGGLFQVPSDIAYVEATHRFRRAPLVIPSGSLQQVDLSNIGSGPFVVVDGRPGQNIVIVRIEDRQVAP